jgi:hypothetical protein
MDHYLVCSPRSLICLLILCLCYRLIVAAVLVEVVCIIYSYPLWITAYDTIHSGGNYSSSHRACWRGRQERHNKSTSFTRRRLTDSGAYDADFISLHVIQHIYYYIVMNYFSTFVPVWGSLVCTPVDRSRSRMAKAIDPGIVVARWVSHSRSLVDAFSGLLIGGRVILYERIKISPVALAACDIHTFLCRFNDPST